jgi:predicted phage baseplate assembly protein
LRQDEAEMVAVSEPSHILTRTPVGEAAPGAPARQEATVCDQALDSLSPPFGLPPELKDVTLAPRVKGVYLNTAWASQSETIKDELVGSSSGDGNQKYTLTKFPVLEEAILVDELGSLTESERKLFTEQSGVKTEEKKDDKGNVVAFWVRWQRVDDLGEANASDRVYTIDQTFGLIQFGDGKHGHVPPIGRDNIRATYQAGGGAAGNVAAGEIKTLRTTIPFVEKATNPEAAGGGSDTELIENTLERGPQMIKNRGRAITAEDFEWLARESSRVITRVKCLPTFNDEGEFETGWVTVIIVPNSTDARPVPSPQLRQRVEKYLSERAANVVSFPKRVRVSAPVYIEVKITADVFPVSLDLAPVVEGDATGALAKFLHPLTGGYQNRGWEFGRLPCLSDFYALLEAVKGVDHVENIVMALRAVTPTGVQLGTPRVVTEEKPLAVEMPQYTLLFSGEHKITTKALR